MIFRSKLEINGSGQSLVKIATDANQSLTAKLKVYDVDCQGGSSPTEAA
jgi:hypothetical protein